MKRTRWYPGAIFPARIGWYEVGLKFKGRVISPRGRKMRYWGGGRLWYHDASRDQISSFSFLGNDVWRGLKEKAK